MVSILLMSIGVTFIVIGILIFIDKIKLIKYGIRTEGEIVDSIRRPLGARTVKGVKRRTGAGFGNCHGAYCNEKIVQILSRELDRKITDIVDDSKNSNIVSGRIKEFKDI